MLAAGVKTRLPAAISSTETNCPSVTGLPASVRLAFVGNVDVRILESGDPERIKREVRYKLQAAKGGGWVFQSDHSVSSGVTPESYELAIQTLRESGKYPLTV